MRNHVSWLALPAIAGALALAQPAAAVEVAYTYTGHVGSGVDGLGLFGQAGASLSGAAFTATFHRDDALADPDDIYIGRFNSYVSGVGAASPVWAELTIGGVTLALGGLGEQAQYDDGFSESFAHYVAFDTGSLMLGASTPGRLVPQPIDYLPGPDYHTLPSLSAETAPGLDWFGNFSVSGQGLAALGTTASFVPTGLLVDGAPGGVGGVPEPASWALMILGFGGVGWTLRRRRATAFA
jgi:hypothetical protein